MDKGCRETKNFLFDLDDYTKDEFDEKLEIIRTFTTVITEYETKNGFHVITKPFNFQKMDNEIKKTIQGNSLMLIDY